jgi:hypothetical protein
MMTKITCTLQIPQTWKNAVWYEGKVICDQWIQDKVNEALDYMEETCGISLDQTETQFRADTIAFRKEQAESERARSLKWQDPEYRQQCYDMVTHDDVPLIKDMIEKHVQQVLDDFNKHVFAKLTQT